MPYLSHPKIVDENVYLRMENSCTYNFITSVKASIVNICYVIIMFYLHKSNYDIKEMGFTCLREV